MSDEQDEIQRLQYVKPLRIKTDLSIKYTENYEDLVRRLITPKSGSFLRGFSLNDIPRNQLIKQKPNHSIRYQQKYNIELPKIGSNKEKIKKLKNRMDKNNQSINQIQKFNLSNINIDILESADEKNNKTFVLKLQRQNPFFKKLNFLTILEIISTCKIIKYNLYQIIFNKSHQISKHIFIIINGSILLITNDFKYYEHLCEIGDTFEEECIIYPQSQIRNQINFMYGKCMKQNTSCILMTRKEWKIIKNKIFKQYKLKEDVNLFQTLLKKNYFHKRSKLNKLQFEYSKQ